MSKNGLFIVIEGGEGVGKGSVISYLQERLSQDSVYFTREPGGTPMAEDIREVLLTPRDEAVYMETELLLVCAARAQHVRNVINPQRASGRHVISDRFDRSTKAYQLYGREREELVPLYQAMNGCARGDCTPDLTILLDLDPEVGLARRTAEGGVDRLDAEPLAFHQRVRRGFLEHIDKDGHAIIIDASQPRDEVQTNVYNIIRDMIEG